MGNVIDTWIVYRTLRLLTTPWDEMDAFRVGLIDAQGTRTAKEVKTTEERRAYTLLHRLVFNLKRILEKLPFGKTKLARYATALFLVKEHMTSKKGKWMMEEGFMEFLNHYAGEPVVLKESSSTPILGTGRYKIMNVMLDDNGESVPKGAVIVLHKPIKGMRVMGVEVFPVMTNDGQKLAVSHDDIQGV